MNTDVDYEAFCRACLYDIERQQRQERDYFGSQSRRLCVTFRRAVELLEPGKSVLSIGAGSAYVEGQLVDRLFDLGMSCEVVKHVPEPPSNHLGKLDTALAEDAAVLLTTPDVARTGNVVRLLVGESPLPDPERFFAPVGVENEGVNRREYTADEIETVCTGPGSTTSPSTTRRRVPSAGCTASVDLDGSHWRPSRRWFPGSSRSCWRSVGDRHST